MGKKILVVDDEPRMCESLNRLLSKEGYAIVTSSGAVDALEEVGKEPFDVVITDVKMPEVDGVSLLKSLKVMNPRIKVIMMTAYGDVDSYLASMNLGAVEYLMKPINFDELKKILGRLTNEADEG